MWIIKCEQDNYLCWLQLGILQWMCLFLFWLQLYSSVDFGKKWILVHERVTPGRFYWYDTHTHRRSNFFTDHQSHITRLQCNFTLKINLTARIYLHAHTHYHRLKINPILNPLSTSKTLTLINLHIYTLYVSFPSIFLYLPPSISLSCHFSLPCASY